MKRKVIQDLANTLCSNYIDLNGGYDAAALAYYGSGAANVDFLSGDCTFNGRAINSLLGCSRLRKWLLQRFETKNIAIDDIPFAQMTVVVAVSDLKLEKSYGHALYSGCFGFECNSEVRTSEKLYFGHMNGEKVWGFGEEYDELRTNSVLF